MHFLRISIKSFFFQEGGLPEHLSREAGETTSSLLTPLQTVIYVLLGIWLALMGACILWELHRRKSKGRKGSNTENGIRRVGSLETTGAKGKENI